MLLHCFLLLSTDDCIECSSRYKSIFLLLINYPTGKHVASYGIIIVVPTEATLFVETVSDDLAGHHKIKHGSTVIIMEAQTSRRESKANILLLGAPMSILRGAGGRGKEGCQKSDRRAEYRIRRRAGPISWKRQGSKRRGPSDPTYEKVKMNSTLAKNLQQPQAHTSKYPHPPSSFARTSGTGKDPNYGGYYFSI